MENNKTCSNCKWWSEPLRPAPAFPERICRVTQYMGSAGAYGQDGKAIITLPHFGCNYWEAKIKKT